jgi:parallel beta-helix repeat protein
VGNWLERRGDVEGSPSHPTHWSPRSRWRSLAGSMVLGSLLLGGSPGAGHALPDSPVPGGASAIEIKELPATPPLVINRPGHYDVTRDLVSTGSGIAITADDVVLDLHGYRLTGPGPDSRLPGGIGTAGVRVEGSGVTIKNGTITGFFAGIHLRESSRNNVALNSIDDCSLGLRATGATHNLVGLNRITAASAIALIGGSGNSVLLNTLRAATDGIQVENSTGNTIDGNTVTGSIAPQPGNSSIGIFLIQASGNTVQKNTVGNFNLGIVLAVDARTTGNLVADNAVAANLEVGIYVASEVRGNTLQGNQVTGNGIADLWDENVFTSDPCQSTWKNNRFATDNEPGASFGPGAGCLQ